MTLKERAHSLKRDIPALYLALKSKETPAAAKILAGLTVALALSPIDLIPDFVPVLGYLDDVLLLPALISLTVKLIPAEVLSDCRRQAEGLWAGGKPRKWYFALPILLLWALIVWLVIRWICWQLSRPVSDIPKISVHFDIFYKITRLC